MEEQLAGRRQISVLTEAPLAHSLPQKRVLKRDLMERKAQILNEHFLKYLEALKLRREQVLDVLEQVVRAGSESIDELFFRGYFFDEARLEFVSRRAGRLKFGLAPQNPRRKVTGSVS